MEENKEVLSFGEVLFDVFDGEAKIGGAPLNFAAHVSRLGWDSFLISAIGKDEMGAEVCNWFDRLCVSQDFLRYSEMPTGTCEVTLNEEKIPVYDLVFPAAWDYISLDYRVLEKLTSRRWRLFYFGSLSQRGRVSADTLKLVLQNIQADIYLFDCNIRPPYESKRSLLIGLKNATHLKISREEAPALERLGLAPAYSDDNKENWCRELSKLYPLKQIILTLDKDGAAVFDAASDTFVERAAEPVPVVSTVGAGDAFAAAYIDSYMRGCSLEESIDNANKLGGEIVQIVGAF